MTTRCKFTCVSVKKIKGWSGVEHFVYEAEFRAVQSDSEENKKFFQYTPTGTLAIGTYKENVFEVGKDYYLDLSEAVPEPAKLEVS